MQLLLTLRSPGLVMMALLNRVSFLNYFMGLDLWVVVVFFKENKI